MGRGVLTRLRVQGFKNLLDVEVHFGPFTCFVGANGVGKSNLFDAIRFLHLLARHPLMEAVQKVRESEGQSPDPASLFTTFGGFRAPEMRFAADLLVERKAEDDFGAQAEAAISSLRYEIAFILEEKDGLSRLKLTHESLLPIPILEARRSLGFKIAKEFRESAIVGRRTKPFISTQTTAESVEITVHQEGHGGRKLPAFSSLRTVLGGVASSEFPTILAVNREMEAWKTLLLEPSAMRAPSSFRGPRLIDSRGGNVPAAIHQLQKSEDRPGRTCAEIANQLAQLLDDVREVRLRPDERSETWTVEVCGRDGVFHPARALSDGTLRFLVLAVLRLVPEARGMICLEEPENGIHPQRIPAMIDLLKGIAVDPDFALGPDNPLRQVVVNTHSPGVVKTIESADLVYLADAWIVRAGHKGRVASIRVPPGSWRALHSKGQATLAPGERVAYLGVAADGWLPMTYHEGGNGNAAEVHAGHGRLE